MIRYERQVNIGEIVYIIQAQIFFHISFCAHQSSISLTWQQKKLIFRFEKLTTEYLWCLIEMFLLIMQQYSDFPIVIVMQTHTYPDASDQKRITLALCYDMMLSFSDVNWKNLKKRGDNVEGKRRNNFKRKLPLIVGKLMCEWDMYVGIK
jgi:hypothetical protein